MIADGLVKEVRGLYKRFSGKEGAAALTAIGYRELFPHLDGKISLKSALQDIERNTIQYAKRQMTWWRGMSDIEWHVKPEAALQTAKKWLK